MGIPLIDMDPYDLTMGTSWLPWPYPGITLLGHRMPKLAIYVPKKAKKEIDRWRKRINFSQMFMRALEGEIRELQLSLIHI